MLMVIDSTGVVAFLGVACVPCLFPARECEGFGIAGADMNARSQISRLSGANRYHTHAILTNASQNQASGKRMFMPFNAALEVLPGLYRSEQFQKPCVRECVCGVGGHRILDRFWWLAANVFWVWQWRVA